MSKISVIIPVYNVENFIAEAIQSCLKQSLQDIEIVIVDDCGTDKSMKIVKEFANQDKRIKVVHNQKNVGRLKARFEGVKSASSEIVMFCDGDDLLEVQACEKVYQEFLDNDLLCFHYKELKQEALTELPNFFVQTQVLTLEEFKESYRAGGGLNMFNSVVLKAFKRDLYLKNTQLHLKNLERNITLAEDALFSTTYLMLCHKVKVLNEFLYIYRYNEDSVTKQKDSSKIKISADDLLFVVDKLQELASAYPQHSKVIQIIICNLKIHYFDLQRIINKNFFYRLGLKIKRKRVKILKNKLLKSPS